MAVLGIKVTPSVIWYAILEGSNQAPKVSNIGDEFRIPMPADSKDQQKKADYVFTEVCKILEHNNNITLVVIRESEYISIARENEAVRFSKNLDGVVMAAAISKGIRFSKKVLKSLGVKKNDVLVEAERISGKTKTYWVKDMAEVILAARIELA